MPKVSRFTLGEHIDRQFILLLQELFRATYASKQRKSIYINEASVNLDLVKLFIRIAWELKHLDTAKYTELSDKLNRLGKMLGGWQKHVRSTSRNTY